MSDEAIRGKVARILNSRELAINVGAADGVKVGMYFDVLDPKGEDIKDPDSGEVLGSLERPKVRVKLRRFRTTCRSHLLIRPTKLMLAAEGVQWILVSQTYFCLRNM